MFVAFQPCWERQWHSVPFLQKLILYPILIIRCIWWAPLPASGFLTHYSSPSAWQVPCVHVYSTGGCFNHAVTEQALLPGFCLGFFPSFKVWSAAMLLDHWDFNLSSVYSSLSTHVFPPRNYSEPEVHRIFRSVLPLLMPQCFIYLSAVMLGINLKITAKHLI